MLGHDDAKEILFQPNRIGGEMIFVPRRGESDLDRDGDDAYANGISL